MMRLLNLRASAPPAADDSGKAIVEFALVAPVFLGLLAGIMEFSGIMFVQTLLEGAAREASRFGITGATEEGISRETAIMQILEDNSFGIIEPADVDMETLIYESFEDVGQPEPFIDENANETYDDGEVYTDINGNGAWDEDMGTAGLGGPGDVVVYRMTYEWPIMIPLFEPFFGDSVTMRSNIAVRNEPFPGE